MSAGTDGLVAVDPSRTDDPDRRLLPFHRPGLNAAGMGTQQPVGLLMDIKSILHVPGRMVLRKIERCEVVPVVFDLRPFLHREA